MSLYEEIVQTVQRQGLAVIFHVVRFSLQEPVVCGLVAGLRVYVEIVQIVQRQDLAVIFHVVRFSLQEPVVCGLVAGLRVYTQTSYQSFTWTPGLTCRLNPHCHS
jgi:hypothetical protein